MPAKLNQTIDERLISKSRVDGDCLIWTASVTTTGYGQININGRPHYAHRLAWECAFGQIPNGLFVCHVCDNRLCIKLAHLFLGTPADNAADMVAKGRSLVGERHPRSKLSGRQIANIRSRYAAGGITQKELGDEYGVSDSHVCGIISGQFWKEREDVPTLRS